MAYTEAAKNTMLGALTPDGVSIHTADPGTTGASQLGTTQAATFGAAAAGSRALSAAVNFTGLTASTATPFWGLWAGVTFLGGGPTSGDAGTNAEGAVTLTTATTFDLNL